MGFIVTFAHTFLKCEIFSLVGMRINRLARQGECPWITCQLILAVGLVASRVIL
jgi:H+/gluconate symporter-like permease